MNILTKKNLMEPKEQISHQIDIINGSSKASQTYAQSSEPNSKSNSVKSHMLLNTFLK